MPNLDDNIHRQVADLCAQGDAAAEAQDFPNAISRYDAAYQLLPVPKEQWEAALWILVAKGDALFQSGQFESARQQFVLALANGAQGNPFVQLRFGQALAELGDVNRAKEWLASAWVSEGDEIFEDEDPKYIRLVPPEVRGPGSVQK